MGCTAMIEGCPKSKGSTNYHRQRGIRRSFAPAAARQQQPLSSMAPAAPARRTRLIACRYSPGHHRQSECRGPLVHDGGFVNSHDRAWLRHRSRPPDHAVPETLAPVSSMQDITRPQGCKPPMPSETRSPAMGNATKAAWKRVRKPCLVHTFANQRAALGQGNLHQHTLTPR